ASRVRVRVRECTGAHNSGGYYFVRAPAPAVLHPLSLHDALPISSSDTTSSRSRPQRVRSPASPRNARSPGYHGEARALWKTLARSEEHTSELQSLRHLVCRLLLEKKKLAHLSDHQTRDVPTLSIA